jgi:hypothetical protein
VHTNKGNRHQVGTYYKVERSLSNPSFKRRVLGLEHMHEVAIQLRLRLTYQGDCMKV